MMNQQSENNGSIVAAMLAAGIGCLVLGLATSLAQGSKAIGNMLNFYNPVGPLGGKTIVAVVVWLVAWGVLPVNGRTSRQTLVKFIR